MKIPLQSQDVEKIFEELQRRLQNQNAYGIEEFYADVVFKVFDRIFGEAANPRNYYHKKEPNWTPESEQSGFTWMTHPDLASIAVKMLLPPQDAVKESLYSFVNNFPRIYRERQFKIRAIQYDMFTPKTHILMKIYEGQMDDHLYDCFYPRQFIESSPHRQLLHLLHVDKSTNEEEIVNILPFKHMLVVILGFPSKCAVFPRDKDKIKNNLRACLAQKEAKGLREKNSVEKIRILEWQKSCPYLELIQKYLEYLVPVSVTLTRPFHQSNEGQERGQLFSREYLSEDGELFLRLIVCHWLECHNVMRSDFENLHFYQQSFHHQKKVEHKVYCDSTHPHPVDVREIEETTVYPAAIVMGIFIVVDHLLKDPKNVKEQFQQVSRGEIWTNPAVGRSSSSSAGISETDACTCPPAFQIIQLSLFDTLRVIFSKGNRFSFDQGSNIYFIAVDTWLMWIQPWRNGGTCDKSWESYIVANYHFYTTLLVLYFKSGMCYMASLICGIWHY